MPLGIGNYGEWSGDRPGGPRPGSGYHPPACTCVECTERRRRGRNVRRPSSPSNQGTNRSDDPGQRTGSGQKPDRSQRRGSKPPKPPKPPKEPKAPKPPKQPRQPKPPKAPKPPRDPKPPRTTRPQSDASGQSEGCGGCVSVFAIALIFIGVIALVATLWNRAQDATTDAAAPSTLAPPTVADPQPTPTPTLAPTLTPMPRAAPTSGPTATPFLANERRLVSEQFGGLTQTAAGWWGRVETMLTPEPTPRHALAQPPPVDPLEDIRTTAMSMVNGRQGGARYIPAGNQRPVNSDRHTTQRGYGRTGLLRPRQPGRRHLPRPLPHRGVHLSAPGGTRHSQGAENIYQGWASNNLAIRNWKIVTIEVGNAQALAVEAVGEWLQSPGHRANILNDVWRQQGIGVAVGYGNRVYLTHNFC